MKVTKKSIPVTPCVGIFFSISPSSPALLDSYQSAFLLVLYFYPKCTYALRCVGPGGWLDVCHSSWLGAAACHSISSFLEPFKDSFFLVSNAVLTETKYQLPNQIWIHFRGIPKLDQDFYVTFLAEEMLDSKSTIT